MDFFTFPDHGWINKKGKFLRAGNGDLHHDEVAQEFGKNGEDHALRSGWIRFSVSKPRLSGFGSTGHELALEFYVDNHPNINALVQAIKEWDGENLHIDAWSGNTRQNKHFININDAIRWINEITHLSEALLSFKGWLIQESAGAARIIYVGEGSEDDDEDENIVEYQKQAWDIAKSSPINILRDKNLNSVALVGDEVAGALFDAWNHEEYSFDVVVSPKFQQRGIGKQLIDIAMEAFRMDSDGYDNPHVKAEVANKNLIPLLTRMGFKQTAVSGGITVMMYGSLDEAAIHTNTSGIRTALTSIKSKLIGHDHGNLEIEEILNQALKPWKAKLIRSFDGESGDPNLARVYITHAAVLENGGIEICYDDNFYRNFDDDTDWDTFMNVIVKLVAHEQVHIGQFNRISIKHDNYRFQQIIKKLEQDPSKCSDYLGSKTEMMAFVREAAEEFHQLGYTRTDILKAARNPFRSDMRSESHVFWTYIGYFEPGDAALKGFLKYLIQYA